MASEKQTSANRRNARKSTGPKTPAGKATAALNATRHGLTASLRPLPVVEEGGAWEAHQEETLRALAPLGYLETILADRVAVLTWRLGRAVRFENEAAAVRQEGVERELRKDMGRRRSHLATDAASAMRARYRGEELLHEFETVADVKETIRTAALGLELMDALPKLGAKKAVGDEAALEVLYKAADLAGVDLETGDLPPIPGVHPEPGVEAKEGWTAGEVRAVLEALVSMSEADEAEDLETLQRETRWSIRMAQGDAERKLATWEREEDQARRERLLPDWRTLENVSRYEGHLHRLLMQTLHELQRLQAARAGGNVAPPAALDVTADLGGCNGFVS